MNNGKLVQFTSAQVRAHLKSTVRSMQPEQLGISVNNVGTHSLRTSCAMLLYLSNVRTSTIMLVGRWKSDAFLLYLRRQVKEFTDGISNQMTSLPDTFFNIASSTNNNDLPSRQRADIDDPMTSNVNSTASRARFNGLALRENTSHFHRNHAPAFNVWG